MKKLTIIVLVVLSMSGCDLFLGSDDSLNLELEGYAGAELKLNGYYYIEESADPDNIFQRYFLYRNGIIREGGAVFTLENEEWLDGQSKLDWGIFQIDNLQIKFEKWYPPSGGPLPAYTRDGEILNDSTFHITESYRVIDGEKTEIREKDEIYHFMEYSPKLDSTNIFIN